MGAPEKDGNRGGSSFRRSTRMDSKYIRRESADKCERGSGGLCAAAQNVLTRLYSFCGIRETSEYYHHDMYHLLASRGIESLNRIERLSSGTLPGDISSDPVKQDIISIYRNMISAYQAAGLNEGYVLALLNYLQWRRMADQAFRSFQAKNGLIGLTQDPYLAALNELKSKFKSEPICAEVYLAQAQFAIEKTSR